MIQSTTAIATRATSEDIGKLSRLFCHKIATEFTPTTGLDLFPLDTCNMTATPTHLIFDITAGNAENVEKIKGILIRHLDKFAYKESLVVEWRDEALS